MWSLFILRRVSSISLRDSASNLARWHYRTFNNKFSITVPEKTSHSYSLLPIRPKLATTKSKPFLSSLQEAALAVLVSGCYMWAHNLTTRSAACQEIKMENIEEGTLSTQGMKPLEMNEVAALTHASLLRQASGVAVDAALQLLHRTLRAILDFSAQYRKQLNEVIDLMEFCTVTMRNPEQHDAMWELLVAARSHTDSIKQQLKDLGIMMSYAYLVLENAGMTAFMSGAESTASAAQQAVTSAKCELQHEAQKNQALEVQYMCTHTRYIQASQQLAEEQEKPKQSNHQDSNQEGEHEASTC